MRACRAGVDAAVGERRGVILRADVNADDALPLASLLPDGTPHLGGTGSDRALIVVELAGPVLGLRRDV